MKNTWGFIGCGNLAQALICGALDKKILKKNQIIASNRTLSKLKKFKKQTGIRIESENLKLIQNSRIVIIGTKPQDILSVLSEIGIFISPKHTVISLAAGVDTQTLRKYMPRAGALVRVMANTPAQIQSGVFGIYFSKANSQVKKNITGFFKKLGTVVILKNDSQIDTITAGSASGTGIVFELLRIFENWFVKKGFSKEQARSVSLETFFGSSLLAKLKSQSSFEELRSIVTSKKGTTLAGLTSMKKLGVQRSLEKSLDAASRRAVEISKSLRQSKG